MDDDAPGGGDGSSWSTAFRFLQDALAAAKSGTVTEIRVARGIHVPDRNEADPGGTGDRIASFYLFSGVALRGGYAGIGAANPDERDVAFHETILSGDLAGDDGPGFANNQENSWRVMTGKNIESTAVLDGLTITAGNANYGGGLYSHHVNLAVLNCTFRSNWALYGGAIYSDSSSLTIGSSTFTDNFASVRGGGVHLSGSTLDISDSTFTGNTAVWGGGMVILDAAVTVSGSTFCDNSPNHIVGNWTDAGGNSLCPLCDKSSGSVLHVPTVYPTIQSAIDAACDGAVVVVSPGTYFETISFTGKAIIVRSTDGPDETTIDGQGTGPVVFVVNGEALETVLEGFTVANGSAELGGGARIINASVSFIDCVFRNNVADIGGAIYRKSDVGGQLDLLRCVFDGNHANYSSGAVFSASGLSAVDCVFTDNFGGEVAGAVAALDGSATYVNCLFAGNSAGFAAGGVADGSANLLVANCVFSRNWAGMGGGLEAGKTGGASGVVTNCTFSLNQGGGVGVSPPLSNCILWGNAPEQIGELSTVVVHSDIQGGWPGIGNIDADPLFVQPGTDDVRLAYGSPCVDAASNAELPADSSDLDGDGDTTEPIPFDHGGSGRVQGAAVDMGAWEGEFESAAPASSHNDLDQGDFVVLVPGGAPFNPLDAPAVIMTNTTGSDNASVVVTQLDGDIHLIAGGFTELGVIFRMATTLADGEYLATVFIPFSATDLAGTELQRMNLTIFDEAVGNWAVASSANSQDSPGFTGPVGNRFVMPAGGGWGLTMEVGDYGVYWDPQLQAGFVWANVDRDGDFAVGFAFCPTDCLQTPDGWIGIQDLLALLAMWGTESVGGPCDTDFDGVIGLVDFVAILDAWGPCVLSSAAGAVRRSRSVAARSPDLDGNGRVDAGDLEAIKTAWGPCRDCRADLDGDGRVDVRDMLALLRDWSAPGATWLGP